MIPEPIEMLMWEKLDGTIQAEDEAKLESVLREDASAREHFAELVRFSELLGGVEEVEPPTALRERIEGAIDFDRGAARHESAAPRTILGWIPSWFDVRLATAAAAGILIGLIGYHLAFVHTDLTRPIDGTTTVGSIGQFQDGLVIDLDGVQGSVHFREDGELAVSRIELASDDEIELSLEYEGRSVEFRAAGKANSPLHDISLSENGVVAKNWGAAEYVATFARAGNGNRPLRVRIVSKDEVLLDEAIHPDHLR